MENRCNALYGIRGPGAPAQSGRSQRERSEWGLEPALASSVKVVIGRLEFSVDLLGHTLEMWGGCSRNLRPFRPPLPGKYIHPQMPRHLITHCYYLPSSENTAKETGLEKTVELDSSLVLQDDIRGVA